MLINGPFDHEKYLRLFSKQLITEKSENVPPSLPIRVINIFVTMINLKKKLSAFIIKIKR